MGERWRIDNRGRRRAVVGSTLTPRELHLARLACADGDPTNAQIAAELFISVSAVQSLLRDIYTRTGVHTRLSLYKWLVARGHM